MNDLAEERFLLFGRTNTENKSISTNSRSKVPIIHTWNFLSIHYFLYIVFTLLGPGVMEGSVGAAPEVRFVPSDVRKILSFLKAIY